MKYIFYYTNGPKKSQIQGVYDDIEECEMYMDEKYMQEHSLCYMQFLDYDQFMIELLQKRLEYRNNVKAMQPKIDSFLLYKLKVVHNMIKELVEYVI